MYLYLIMAVAFIGMVVGLQKEKAGATWGRPVAILCILVAVAAAIYSMVGGGKPDTGNRERAYREIKGRKVGTYLAGKFSGKKIVVLLPPETAMPQEGGESELPHKAVLEGFTKGLDGKLEVVGTIDPKMPADIKAKMEKAMADGGEGMMMAEGQPWFGVKELNKELEAYKGKYDILVCLTGLPGVEPPMGNRRGFVSVMQLSAMKDKEVKIAMAEGGIAKFGKAIQSGKVIAAVSHKRDMKDEDYDKDPVKDLDEAFGTRFVLVTPENVKEHSAQFGK